MRVIPVALAIAALAGSSCSGSSESTVDDGEAITVFGPWLAGDADAFALSLESFGRSDVRYTGSANFSTDLGNRIASGTGAPDVAMIPQPALIAELVAAGDLVPLNDEVIDAIAENYPVDARAPTVDGEVYVVPYRSNVKSLVWFRPDVFAQYGWSVPTTLDSLHSLVDEIQSTTDVAPWCFSIFAGRATGWPATDWIEDLLLRRLGPDAYDQWVTGDLRFDDETVRGVFEEFEDLLLASGRSAGGQQAILEVEVPRTSAPLFTDSPGCAMYKQGSFATSWFPDGVDIGPDGGLDYFVLPGVGVDETPPLLVGGTGAVQFSDRAEVSDLMAYLASPSGAEAWAQRGNYSSTRSSVDPDDYYRGADRDFSQLLQDAAVTRFDASDQFTSGLREAELTGITSWIAGRQTLDDLLASLDDAR